MNRNGVIYDVGSVSMGINWRPDYSPQLARRELQVIAHDLHCNAVKIRGRDIERVLVTGRAAVELGMEAWLSPELFGRGPAETLRYIEQAAEAAEQLRRRWPDKVVLSIGTELTLFMRGMVPGRTYGQRVRHVKAGPREARVNTPVGAFVADAARAARRHFDGPVTYAAFPFERVDWRALDIVGVNHYLHRLNADRYIETLQPARDFGKPLVISELGFRTSADSDDAALGESNNVRPIGMLLHGLPGIAQHVQPRVKTVHERNEAAQAARLIGHLQMLDGAEIDGAFIYTFTFPLLVHSLDPRRDLDADSFSLVKSLGRGAHGTTFPDMTWEPKRAFHALADHNIGL